MKTRPKLFRKSADGSVAIELAIVLPILLMFLAVPLFLARIFWFYSVGQKAAHDAARYLSTATQAEMRTAGGGFNEAKVAAVARWIAQQELEEILPFTDSILIDVQCNTGSCGAIVPTTVHVGIQITVHDMILDSITSQYFGSTDRLLLGNVTVRYVGS